jgi:hypothetical protein
VQDEVGFIFDGVLTNFSLEMAQKLVETENIEFIVLVDRLQEINRRLENDTT